MSRESDIHSEIHHLKDKIRGYENEISDLENKSSLIEGWQRNIQEGAYEPEKAYDMTYGGNFTGELEIKAEEYRTQLCRDIEIGQNGTSQLLSDIQRIIETIRERIEECWRRISDLEDELEALAENNSHNNEE